MEEGSCLARAAQMRDFSLHLAEAVVRRIHWILESPLVKRSLKGMVERDTVKGSLWRPAKTQREQKKGHNVTHNHKVERKTRKAKKNIAIDLASSHTKQVLMKDD
ncbi:hypothetical protein INR49_009207 [Caranx melampygus]|nr:hypothetical protein INR49_009207 [Caranx melampygus]